MGDEPKSISLRYFNAAGCDPEGQLGERHNPETHLIPLVLQEAVRVQKGGNPENTNLHVFGEDYDTPDGTCIRDYIHVQDLCDAHMQAAKMLLNGAISGAEAFNLGNGIGFSVKEVIGLRNPICIIPNGIDPIKPGLHIPSPWTGKIENSNKVLLYLGRIHPKKGLVHLLNA